LLACWLLAWAGESEPIAPRGLLPRISTQPVGGPETVGENVRLGVAVRCAGRPVEGVKVMAFRDRACRQELWNGLTDAQGLAQPVVPAAIDPHVVCVLLEKAGYSSPAHIRLWWEPEKKNIRIDQDVTEWESTARLGKWELADGGAHVYFDWAQREFAEELLKRLSAQRRAVRELLGAELEPMGAIVVKDADDEARYITRRDNKTLRRGVFIHGVRSWPIVATSLKELGERHAELHEFNLVLTHELTENSLFGPPFVGIQHRGTRWLRDGLAELVECTVPAAEYPDLVASHLNDRIEHLKQGLAAGETKVDLLAWEQDGGPNTLARYAAALASMHRIVEAIGWDGLRRVLATASGRMTTTSEDLQRMLAEAGAKEQIEGLKSVDLAEAIKTLEALKAKRMKQ
jgi:hypothetical protein